MSIASLAGLTVLVVEDESMVSFLIEDMLRDLGCAQVWHASNLTAALKLLDEKKPDAAVLDVNLAGEFVYPVAERLEAMGVPFIFATGYGAQGMPKHWAEKPVATKPFRFDTFAALLGSSVRK